MQSKPLMDRGWLVYVSLLVHMSPFNEHLSSTCHQVEIRGTSVFRSEGAKPWHCHVVQPLEPSLELGPGDMTGRQLP